MREPNLSSLLSLDSDELRSDEVDPARAAMLARLREALEHGLTERQRQAIEMHFFDGLSQSEIARRLGVTQQVVHKRIYGVDRRGKRIGGALAKLRRALDGAHR
ncbi:MAG: sigma-70 family RNA polymerase sigma factor [Polyangiales bacterium]